MALAAAWVRRLKESSDRQLLGRCLDVKGAYKQIALARKDRPNAVLAVFNPIKEQWSSSSATYCHSEPQER